MRHQSPQGSTWQAWALASLRAEERRSAGTHLRAVPLVGAAGIRLYLKDESGQPTGSLKHRLARALFAYALCNGWIDAGTLVVDASSGSTAVSEAYFAQLLGLPFVAVMPAGTSAEKCALIERYGGRCHFVAEPGAAYAAAAAIAVEQGGCYLNQFAHAERATDWRRDNIAADILAQLADEPHPEPRWFVCGAGTGGTATTIGRHLRHAGRASQLCVVDPQASVFHRHFYDRAITTAPGPASVIEGIGRQQLEPSFLPDVVDRMIAVSDADAIAAARHLAAWTGLSCGPSTGANLQGCLVLIDEMRAAGEQGTVVSLLCDAGSRYLSTSLDPAWCAARGLAGGGHPLLARLMPVPAGAR
ncbi:MAG TPA: pyridoxal-phosphate dependent enzyme [Novosphingobium sp.]|nr:pyridoxal-phosphate dependent enzyme [Novosphingobium sp.]